VRVRWKGFSGCRGVTERWDEHAERIKEALAYLWERSDLYDASRSMPPMIEARGQREDAEASLAVLLEELARLRVGLSDLLEVAEQLAVPVEDDDEEWPQILEARKLLS
jgi:hypothetical protein